MCLAESKSWQGWQVLGGQTTEETSQGVCEQRCTGETYSPRAEAALGCCSNISPGESMRSSRGSREVQGEMKSLSSAVFPGGKEKTVAGA